MHDSKLYASCMTQIKVSHFCAWLKKMSASAQYSLPSSGSAQRMHTTKCAVFQCNFTHQKHDIKTSKIKKSLRSFRSLFLHTHHNFQNQFNQTQYSLHWNNKTYLQFDHSLYCIQLVSTCMIWFLFLLYDICVHVVIILTL